MRLIIIGAGAVGGTLGARLSQSGHDVVLVARGAHGDAIRTEGLTFHAPEGTATLRVPVVSGPDELTLTEDDVLVCAVKSQDTQAVIDTWAHVPVAPSGRPAAAALPFVVAQNGVSNEVAALRVFARVYPVCVWLPASYLEPGTVHAEGAPYSGFLTVGRLGGPLDQVSAALVSALGASRFVAVEDADVMRWKHGKLLSNLRNGLDATCGNGPGTADLAQRLGDEGRAALTAAGIPFSAPEEEAARRGDSVQVRPASGSGRGGSSTWQSLARGTGSIEVDHLNGEIGLLGRLHGVPTPVNDAVQLAAHRLRREGRPPRSLPVAELQALVAGIEATPA
jgi:2-dehydropantoate 2-reductase